MQGAASSQSLLSALTEFSIKAAAAAFHPRAEPPEGTAFTRLTGSLSCSCFYPGIGAALLGFQGSGMGFALPPPDAPAPGTLSRRCRSCFSLGSESCRDEELSARRAESSGVNSNV